MKDFTAKIFTDKWEYRPSEERYALSIHEKHLRILQQIFKIILAGTKKSNILSLYINEELIAELANENAVLVESILGKLDEYEGINLETRTSRGLGQLKKLLQTVKMKQEQLEYARNEAEARARRAEDLTEAEAERRKKAENKAEEAERHRKYAETENVFLKSTSLQDKDQIISLFHHIGIHSDTIKTDAARVLKYLSENKAVPDHIIRKMEGIAKLSQVINTISKIGFKGGITEEMEIEKQDIVRFICEFLRNICVNYYSNVSFEIENHVLKTYSREFAPFELTYIIDNFINNSKKAGATKIYFKCYESDNIALIDISDNGKGLDPKIVDIEDVFKRNVTTTRGGAGLGLYDARTILSKINCKIYAIVDKGKFMLRVEIPYEN